MRIFGRRLHEVAEIDLRGMLDIANENTALDFKREMYGNSDADKKEFAKDVSGLANAVGGHLIIGVSEEDGVAKAITPIPDFNPDRDIMRLGNILRDGVEPRLTGVDFAPVPVDSGHVLLIEVPASWNPPHRVNMKSNQFFLRHPRSTDPMSVEEIRHMVLRTVDREQAARQFRDDRVRQLAGNQSVLTPNRDCFVVLHIVPMANSRPPLDFERAIASRRFFPPRSDGHAVHPNFDGLGRQAENSVVSSRIQVYRNGVVEAVIYNCLVPSDAGEPPRVHLGYIQHLLFQDMPSYVLGLEVLGFGLPYAIFLTVSGTLSRGLLVRSYDDFSRSHLSTRETLPCEPVLLEIANIDGTNPQAPWRKVLRPVLDQLWQSFGFQRCYSFNEDGSWKA